MANNIFAIPEKSAARPVNPKSPATIAKAPKIKAHFKNIVFPFL